MKPFEARRTAIAVAVFAITAALAGFAVGCGGVGGQAAVTGSPAPGAEGEPPNPAGTATAVDSGVNGTPDLPPRWAGVFPDGRIDVCLRLMAGAQVEEGEVLDALRALDGTVTGRAIALQDVRRKVAACTLTPPFDPAAGESGVELTRFNVVDRAAAAPFDLVLYVYPQSIAGRIGKQPEDRIFPQEFYAEGEGLVPGPQAVVFGDREYHDAAFLARMMADGLGLSGPRDQ